VWSMSNGSTSNDSSELAELAREFADVIRAVQAEDLTATERAALRSLFDDLKELGALSAS
jgi:hypothetical protein